MANLRNPSWYFKILLVILAPAVLWLGALWIYSLRPLPPLPNTTGKRTVWASAEWAHVPAEGERCILANNVWNKGKSLTNFEQEIFLEDVAGKPAFGWRWRSPWQIRPSILAYPELICGNKPWDEPIGAYRGLPFHPGEKQLSADFHIRLQATGTYNMAFEFWAVSQLPPAPSTIRSEVMIWLANSGQRPSGIQRGTIEVAGIPFDIFINEHQRDASGASKNEWVYVAYVARKPLMNGPLDFGPFLEDLRQRRVLNKDLWITNVELGNEVAEGTGIVEVQDFALHLGEAAVSGPVPEISVVSPHGAE